MRKIAKRKVASKSSRNGAVAENHNGEAMIESTQEEIQQPRELVAAAEEEEEAVVDEENGENDVVEKESDQDGEVKEDNKAGDELNVEKKARGRKRKGTTKKEDEKKPAAPVTKKPRVAKPKEEPEYFEEKRPLEDLWKVAFPVGTEWDQLDSLYEFNWDFKNLEEAFEEEGLLYGKKVFVFGCSEPQLVPYKGLDMIVLVPAIVAVESPFPPSDKIGIKSVQREVEEIIPMKKMKMDWLPYISFEKRDRQIDRMNFKIFTLGCTLRRYALRHMKEDQVKKFVYCLPYFYQPFMEDELEESTVVQIMFPSEPPVVCEFDWEHDELDGPENFVDKLIEEEALAAEEKDEFKEFVKEQVRAAKRANREAREARSRARNEMSAETRQAFQSMKFYKFYPRLSPDTPDVSGVKSPFINRYYGKAHQVL